MHDNVARAVHWDLMGKCGFSRVDKWFEHVPETVLENHDYKLQGRLMTERWEDKEIGDECFSWINEWKRAPTHTISGMQELYQQMLPTKVYHREKTGLQTDSDVMCRLCRKQPET